MLFFRSEEHLKNWDQFEPTTIEGIIPLNELVRLFSTDFFRRRLDKDYLSQRREYLMELVKELGNLKGAGSFWRFEKRS